MERRIELVEYRPDDFSQGNVLSLPHGQTLTDPGAIGAALSLYFQWPSYRKATMYLDGTRIGHPCSMSYDHDEATPTEIRAVLPPRAELPQDLREGKPVVVVYEVFHVAYRFNTTLLAIHQLEGTDGSLLIIDMPSSLVVEKLRSMPRHSVNEAQRTSLGPVMWKPDGAEKAIPLDVVEIGPRSLGTRQPSAHPLLDGPGQLTGAKTWKGHVFSRGDRVVIQPDFSSTKDFGAYFEWYSRIAFPNLRPRSKSNARDVLTTYEKTGYFRKFTSGDSEEQRKAYYDEILSTWTDLEDGFHETTADYCAVDDQGRITGASSATLCFLNGQRPVWIMHQMASVQDPKLIERTSELYVWRPVYLWARGEQIDVGVWFDGRSRWMERTWIKFQLQRSSPDPCIWPVRCNVLNRQQLAAIGTQRTNDVKRQHVGKFERHIGDVSGILSGLDPYRLNVSGLLNHAFSIPPGGSLEPLTGAIRDLQSSACHTPNTFYVTVAEGTEDPILNSSQPGGSNRLCYMPSQDLPLLNSSLVHSLAVLERKNGNLTGENSR